MNQITPAEVAPKPSLTDALADIFATSHQRGFAEKLIRFAEVLTNAHWVCCLIREPDADPVTLAGAMPEKLMGTLSEQIIGLLSDDDSCGEETLSKPPVLLSRIALPDGTHAVLALGVPGGNNVQFALTYERIVFLSALTFARNKPMDRTRQDRLILQVQAVAQGGVTDLIELTNLLAVQTGASYAASAYWKSGAVDGLTISGQDKAAKRASLPDRLRRELRETARQRLLNSERCLAAAPDQADGLILHLENPTRNLGTLHNLAAVYALAQRKHRRSWITGPGLVRFGGGLLAVLGIGLIPLPDSVELPAVVEAQTQRIVTAPLTATLNDVFVQDGENVATQGVALLTLDSTEAQTELIGVRAEHAKALLEREAARAARNPASLRNAELEVERLKSRIELLEYRLQSARVLAPISGLVIAPDLKARQGTTVRQGEDLLTLTDPTKLRLKLSIPETQIGKLEDGATGIFRPDYDPTLRVESTISLISPAKIGDGPDEMFLGRARFDGPADGLRPGLHGVLAVQRETKPLGQIVYQAIRNYVLLRLWL